jgi:hypothetical protein
MLPICRQHTFCPGLPVFVLRNMFASEIVTMIRLLLFLCSCFIATTVTSIAQESTEQPSNLTLSDRAFVENGGQWDDRARFHLSTSGLDLWIGRDEVMYDVRRYNQGKKRIWKTFPYLTSTHNGDDSSSVDISGHVVRMRFAGAHSATEFQGVDRAAGNFNYFIDNDRTRWAVDVRRYRTVRINQLYDGIDAVYYLDGGRPRYDLIVSPGANPQTIGLHFEGASRPRLGSSGELIITTSVGDLVQQAPVAYQIVDGTRRTVPCTFIIGNDGTVGFRLGSYDTYIPLVIDPLIYSTFIGGSSLHLVGNMALDASGNTYIAGTTTSSGYPTTTGAYQTTFNKATSSSATVFVTKLNPAGSALVFSTFIGGTASTEIGAGIALDTARNIYVTGRTTQAGTGNDFPVTTGAYQSTRPGGPDAFVLKLNAAGNALVYSTFLGGPGVDYGADIAVDIQGNAYVTGQTDSIFPTTSGAFAQTKNAMADNFVSKLNAGGTGLVFSTYIGGNHIEAPLGIAIDTARNVYIVGQTGSSTYPTTTGAYDRTRSADYDAYVTKLNSAGSALVYSSFLGGSTEQVTTRVVANPDGSAVVLGITSSTDFPTTSGAYSTSYNGGDQDNFLTKFNAAGSSLVYSTFIGSNWNESAYRLALDRKGNVYVAGTTSSTTFPTSTDAYDDSSNGGEDLYVLKMNNNATALLYSTYIGGSDDDIAAGIRIDTAGNAFVSGYTYSTDFPTTNGAFSTTNSYSAVFALKLPVPTVTLTAPLGGETWCSGITRQITWTSSAVDSVSVQLSSDGGSTWTTLVARLAASSGSWGWVIPAALPAGNNYRIRIYDPANPPVSDTSRTSFTIAQPPSITAPPSSVTLCAGGSATFSITATGTGITYQWRKNSSNIPGATGTSYSIPSAQSSDAGTYDVVVSGTCTPAVTSAAATLTVNTAPRITTEPASISTCQGESTQLSVIATGSGLTYQWRRSGTNISGATVATYTIPQTQLGDTGIYDVIVSGTCTPPDTSISATLTVMPVPTITLQPAGVALCAGDTTRLRIGATGPNLKYQWRHNGVNIPGATDSVLIIEGVQASDGGAYDVDVTSLCPTPTNSSDAVVVVNLPPTIVAEPSHTTVCMGQPATLSVVADGADLTYQWRKNGTVITGATTSTLNFSIVQPSDTGRYDVIINGSCQPPVTTNEARLALTQSTSITISSQPQDTSVCTGSRLTLEVGASGASLNYQWRRNGAVVQGATARRLIIPAVTVSDTGSYDVIIGSACGDPVTSNSAHVSVIPSTSIVIEPRDSTIDLEVSDGNVTLTVSAIGEGLSYQWRKDEVVIPGANAPSYTISFSSFDDGGFYDVIVSGSCGNDTSRKALIVFMIWVGVPGNVEKTEEISSLQIIPHPATRMTKLIIHAPELSLDRHPQLYLYDAVGLLALDLSSSFEQGNYKHADFDAGSLPSGIYTCQLVTRLGSRLMGVVVVAR